MSTVTYKEASRLALAEEMRRDPTVWTLGEDVGDGGVFGQYTGLRDEFGPDRVVSTPISEATITGAAVGAAMVGTRPVVELRFADFALCAMDALEAAGGAGVIVTDPVTSTGMGPFIEQRGGVHDRFQMGYRNVIDRAAETTPEPALLAIETSGHSAWRDNAFVDDGCYTAARLIGRLARERRAGSGSEGLLELLGGTLEEPVESIKVKMGVAAGLPGVPAAEEALCAALRRCADAEPTWEIEKVNHDGLRCAAGPDGWLIIRGSLHEPSVSVQTESDVAGGTAAICATLLKYVNEGEGFEVAPLAKAGAAAAPATTPAAAPSGEGGEADFGAPPEGFVWAEGVF